MSSAAIAAPVRKGEPWNLPLETLDPRSLQQDGDSVLLRLPAGGFWRLRSDSARLALEESVYFGGESPRRSEQIVLTAPQDGPQQEKWAITKIN